MRKKSLIVDLGMELNQMYLQADGLRAKIQTALDTRNRQKVEKLVAEENELFERIDVVEQMYAREVPIEISN